MIKALVVHCTDVGQRVFEALLRFGLIEVAATDKKNDGKQCEEQNLSDDT